MGTDFSKVLHDALDDYSGVKLGQGRVLLDSDANELMDVVDRRIRALAVDVLNRATVPAATPDAFRIQAVPGGGLTIGAGRLYVDGLAAECHGAEPAPGVLDEILDEAHSPSPVPFSAQPYWPQPPALPTSGTFLVYLDVWKREVTHLEQPDLVETALGVDTSSREQIAWQVRLLDVDADATCATPDGELPAWEAIIARQLCPTCE